MYCIYIKKFGLFHFQNFNFFRARGMTPLLPGATTTPSLQTWVLPTVLLPASTTERSVFSRHL
jgi:hypothetical protein